MTRSALWRFAFLFLVGVAAITVLRELQSRTDRVNVVVGDVRVSFALPKDFDRAPEKNEEQGAFFATPDAQKGLWFTFLEDDSGSSPEQMRDAMARMLERARPMEGVTIDDILLSSGVMGHSGVKCAELMYRIKRENPEKPAAGTTWHWHLIFRYEGKLFKLAGHMRASEAPDWRGDVAREFGPIFESIEIEKIR